MPTIEEMAAALSGVHPLEAARQQQEGMLPKKDKGGAASSFVLDSYIPHVLDSFKSLPQRATEAAGQLQQTGDQYDPGPVLETAMTMTGARMPFIKPGELGAAGGKGISAGHASPHDFDRFDFSKVRTGQGANSYGEGGYFGTNPKVIDEYYREFLNKMDANSPEWWAAKELHAHGGDRAATIDTLQTRRKLHNTGQLPLTDPVQNSKAIGLLESSKHVGPYRYDVNINAHPEELLNWDKRLTEQPEHVRSALDKLGIDTSGRPAELHFSKPQPAFDPKYENIDAHGGGKSLMLTTNKETGITHMMGHSHAGIEQKFPSLEAAKDYAANVIGKNITGGEAYQKLGYPSYKVASDALKNQGVQGISYLDQFSRWAPKDSQLVSARSVLADLESGKIYPNNPVLRKQSIVRQKENIADLQKQIAGKTSNYVAFNDKIIDILKKYGIAGGAGPAAMAEALGQKNQQ